MSKIEVDAIDKQSGSTLTLGGSGTAVTLACGATQTGFGRTGTVDWQTGSIKTATFTAANGEGYFCDTAGGSFEVDLPAGSAGAIVSIQDYNNTFDSNSLTVDPNGSEKINGGTAGAPVSLTTEGLGITFVYIDATVGWRSVQSNEYATAGAAFICASVSGACNTITTCGDCKIATFKGPGNFTVNSVATCATNNLVSYIVVAGGGGGTCAGAGAGGFRETKSPVTPYTASPLCGYATPANRITVTATAFPIVVGGGGTAGTGGPSTPFVCGGKGNTSSFSTIASAGGGRGNGNAPPCANQNGGSGGGGRGGSGGTSTPNYGTASSGNTPPVTPSQGNDGGAGSGPVAGGGPPAYRAGGGGGAGSTGVPGPDGNSGNGGDGIGTAINPAVGDTGPSGSLKYFSGGGGAAQHSPPGYQPASVGGYGGGGDAPTSAPFSPPLVNGQTNTGGGGAGMRYNDNAPAGAGGSGVVVIRYKFQ
jgi:hypothetical protein